ncbi:MAG: acyltransferase [Porticoccaceae bacterium]|nr:acyltransferase [Porticoccaceae bacterium]
MINLWRRAVVLAAKTPDSRNRSADLFRALSILVVIFGHWLMAAPYIDATGLHIDHILVRAPWTQWLTWGLQVMPVFFFVGGFSNGITWDAATRDGRTYGEWLSTRLRRLLYPVFVLIVFWTLIAAVAHQAGVAAEIIKVGSQIALVPTWFLAIYAVIVVLAPLARMVWLRWGMLTIATLALLSIGGDLLYFYFDLKLLGWANYLFVWLAVHQLGYAWLDGRFASTGASITWCLIGAVSLIAMVKYGPWPLSLVGVPGAEVTNTTPPHLPLLALAACQFGFVLTAQGILNRALQNLRLWAATVLLNGMIMTIFLWHSTVMILLFGVAVLAGGVGLQAEPVSSAWWSARAVWMLVFMIGLVPFVAAFLRFESAAFTNNKTPGVWRLLMGTGLMAGGLALTAYGGIAGNNLVGLQLNALALFFVGAFGAGIVPYFNRVKNLA